MDQILKHKIGQMIVAGFPSPYVDAQARRLVEDFAVGNFALFGRNYVTAEQTTQMCRDLHKLVYEKNGYSAYLASDQEGGVVSRVCIGSALFPGTSVVYPMNDVDEAALEAIRADDYDVAVLALYNARFRKSQQVILRELEAQNRPLVVLLLGAPYDVPLIRNAKCVICAYEYTCLSAEALLSVLETGQFKGHLPVKLQ